MMNAITLTDEERHMLRQKLGLDERSGLLLDTRLIGDIADHHIQRGEGGDKHIPHDLLPRWFVVTLIVACVLWSVFFYFHQPSAFWWIG